MSKTYVWDWCPTCKVWYIICPTCGNNCCNGTYGRIDNKECPDCPGAYDYQDAHYAEQILVPHPFIDEDTDENLDPLGFLYE